MYTNDKIWMFFLRHNFKKSNFRHWKTKKKLSENFRENAVLMQQQEIPTF